MKQTIPFRLQLTLAGALASIKRTQPFLSLIFRGIWKFLLGNSSAGFRCVDGVVLLAFKSITPLFRRSDTSCSDICSSSHPACSPFCLDVAEIVSDNNCFWELQLSEEIPLDLRLSLSFSISALELQAIFRHCWLLLRAKKLVTALLCWVPVLLSQPPPLCLWRMAFSTTAKPLASLFQVVSRPPEALDKQCNVVK